MKKLVALGVFFLSFTVVAAQQSDDYRWDSRFGLPGISFPESPASAVVSVIASTSDYLIVAGRFTVPGNNIALWNKHTTSWEKAGGGITLSNQYSSISGILAEGDSAIIWGDFTSAGGKLVNRIAILNLTTKEWHPSPDTLLTGTIYSIIREGNDLIYSGEFSIKGTQISNLARWNGWAWSAFTTDTTQQILAALTIFKKRLFALGRLRKTDRVSMFAEWNGTKWEKVFDTVVKSPLSYIGTLWGTATGNSLYLYGGMDSVHLNNGGGLRCRDIVRYDGTTWEAITDTISYYTSTNLQSACVVGDDLYIASDFVSVNGIEAIGIARWNEKTRRWSTLGSGLSRESNVRCIASDGISIYVGGHFAIAGAKFVNNIAQYSPSNSTWSSLIAPNSFAPNGRTNITTDNGQLIAIGNFTFAGEKQINSIGSWNGHEWNTLGSGIIGGAQLSPGKGVAIGYYPLGLSHFIRFGGSTYIAGLYDLIGGQTCLNINRYDNGQLECLGGGVDSSLNGTFGQLYYPSFISSLVRIGQSLYVAGDFSKAGKTAANCIASWNGNAWSALGNGISTPSLYPPQLAVDSAGNLLVAGSFDNINGKPSNGLARWNGTQWASVGYEKGSDKGDITALCVAPNNDIYIAGNFTIKTGKQVLRIARWDGLEWHDLDGGLSDENSSITTMAIKGDLLYIAGSFNHVGTIEAKNAAVWNTTTRKWSALGSGLIPILNGRINSITFISDTVYFGGEIAYAGDKPSMHIAAWLPTGTSSVEQLSTEAPKTLALTFSPNPASANGTFDFHLEKSSTTRLVLADALGREVMTIAEGTFTAGSYRVGADVSRLSAGMYYARLYTEYGATVQTAVIQR